MEIPIGIFDTNTIYKKIPWKFGILEENKEIEKKSMEIPRNLQQNFQNFQEAFPLNNFTWKV